jgi:hypothetical protein
MIKRILPLFWIGLTLLLAWLYAEIWRFDISFETTRPYVYRQFVPLSAAVLVWLTGLSLNQAVVLVVILCSLGFAFAARYLYGSFHEKDLS